MHNTRFVLAAQPTRSQPGKQKLPPKAILHSITGVYVYALHYRFTAWHKHFHSLAAQVNNTLQHDADTHVTLPGWCVTVDQPREDSSPYHALRLQSSEEFLSSPLGPRLCRAGLQGRLHTVQQAGLPFAPAFETLC